MPSAPPDASPVTPAPPVTQAFAGAHRPRPATNARLLLLLTLPLLAAKKPPPPPPLPPLTLPADAPVITASLDGQPLTLRIDPAATTQISLNGSAARRLGLTNAGRLVDGEPAQTGTLFIDVGKVRLREVTTNGVLVIADRPLAMTLASGDRDHVTGADGLINPALLPHDEVRLVRRAATPADRSHVLPARFDRNRGLISETPVGKHRIDIIFTPVAGETIATAAAAAFLVESQGGRYAGPPRDALVAHGVARPVRDIALDRPFAVAGLRVARIAARLFDWSGKTSLPAEARPDDEIVATARFDGQRQWAKLAIGADHLDACASLVWQRPASTITLTCPA
jgi:hypothetical protein